MRDQGLLRSQGRPQTGKMLSGCIEELARAYQNDQRMTSFINAVNRKGKMPAYQFAGTALSLNASNHEPDLFVTGPDVHEAWERIKPILIEIVGKLARQLARRGRLSLRQGRVRQGGTYQQFACLPGPVGAVVELVFAYLVPLIELADEIRGVIGHHPVPVRLLIQLSARSAWSR